MKAYCIGLCLLLTGNVVSQDRVRYEDWIRFEEITDEGLAWARDTYNQPETLKKNLTSSEGGLDLDLWEIPFLIRKFNIAEDTLRRVLMEVCHEMAETTGWESYRHDNQQDGLVHDKRNLQQAIEWLGYCADETGKEFLMAVASDGTKGDIYRTAAVRAYLQRADARQARDALVRFFSDTKGIPYAPYSSAIAVYDESEGDAQKCEAIAASLIVALARESHRGLFYDTDKKLAMRSKEYATSAQRLAMLKRMSKLPPTNGYGDSAKSLDPALASFRFRLFKTNVSTNLTELMARDFGKPE